MIQLHFLEAQNGFCSSFLVPKMSSVQVFSARRLHGFFLGKHKRLVDKERGVYSKSCSSGLSHSITVECLHSSTNSFSKHITVNPLVGVEVQTKLKLDV